MPDPNLQPIVEQGWAYLHPILTTVLSSTAISTLLSVGLIALITAKAKGRVDAHYAQALERLKADLKREADKELATLQSQLRRDTDKELEAHKSQLKGESESRLEVHKAELKRSGDTEIEKLRAQLAAAHAERTTLLAALTTRRFDAIKTVHAKLLRFHRALADLTAPMRFNGTDEEALRTAVAQAAQDFDASLPENEIFLTESAARLVKDIRQKLVVHGNLFNFTVALNARDPKRAEKWADIDGAVRGPISEAIDELARELRALMGDKPSDSPARERGGATTPTRVD